MEFLKRLTRSLFGSFRSSAEKKPIRQKRSRRLSQTKTGRGVKRRKPAARRRPIKQVRNKTKRLKTGTRIKKRAVQTETARTGRSRAAVAEKHAPRGVFGFLGAGNGKAEVLIGEITHFFPQVKAGVLKIKSGPLSIGDQIIVRGATTSFKQKVSSLQINRIPIETGRKGEEVGMEMKKRVRIGDQVFKIKK